MLEISSQLQLALKPLLPWRTQTQRERQNMQLWMQDKAQVIEDKCFEWNR
jgi:hypothetical protein